MLNHEKYPSFPATPDEKPIWHVLGYIGWRDTDGNAHACKANGDDLDPRLDIRNYSPTGFEWGYGGSGPAQLAIAIIADFAYHKTANEEETINLYQRFKFKVIDRLDRHSIWHLTENDVGDAIVEIYEQIRAQGAANEASEKRQRAMTSASQKLCAHLEKVEAFVKELAEQERTDEMEDPDDGDYEDAWDYIINDARRLMKEVEGHE